jgi:hypothetical protein
LPAAKFAGDAVCGADAVDGWGADGAVELSSARGCRGGASALVGVRVRYGRPRRGELPDPFREQVAWAFSVPGSWSSLDVSTVDVNQTTAELTFPSNFLGLGYDEVEVTYTSGVTTIPDAVKVACVQIVRNAQATPGMNVKSSKMDTLQMQYFSGSLIDPQVQMLLKPYVAERLG